MKSDGYKETAAAAAYVLFGYPAAAAAAGGRHKEERDSEFGSAGARAAAVPLSPLGRARAYG